MFHLRKRKAGKEHTYTPLHSRDKIWVSYRISPIRSDTPTQRSTASLEPQPWCMANLSLERPARLNFLLYYRPFRLGPCITAIQDELNLYLLFKIVFRFTHQALLVLKTNSASVRPYRHRRYKAESMSLSSCIFVPAFQWLRWHTSPFGI